AGVEFGVEAGVGWLEVGGGAELGAADVVVVGVTEAGDAPYTDYAAAAEGEAAEAAAEAEAAVANAADGAAAAGQSTDGAVPGPVRELGSETAGRRGSGLGFLVVVVGFVGLERGFGCDSALGHEIGPEPGYYPVHVPAHGFDPASESESESATPSAQVSPQYAQNSTPNQQKLG
ncbi:hypothetical protein CVT26_015276, partial [Gymnopilus dilepis]